MRMTLLSNDTVMAEDFVILIFLSAERTRNWPAPVAVCYHGTVLGPRSH